MLERSEWIKSCEKNLRGGTVFLKEFRCDKPVRKAVLEITALGVYEAKLNGGRVGATSSLHRAGLPTPTGFRCRAMM